MKAFQRNSALFFIFLFLSALPCAAIVSGLSGVRGPGGFSPSQMFFADIVKEMSYGTSLPGPAGRFYAGGSGGALADKCAVKAHAENGGGDITGPAALPEESRPEPVRTAHYQLYCSREKFYFDIYWLGIYVGNATIEAVNDAGTVRITSQVYSAPVISTFYKVEDYAESELKKGLAAHFRIMQREGRYRSDKETIFDTDGGKIRYFNYLKGTQAEHDMEKKPMWDVVSGFYFLRTQFFEVGKKVYIEIFDSDKIYTAEVSVLRKEKVKLAEKGDVDAVVVKPVLKSEGLFHHKGDILVWLTDDEKKIPVKVETKVPIGTVRAELKRVETE
jgi:hypothetical protein